MSQSLTSAARPARRIAVWCMALIFAIDPSYSLVFGQDDGLLIGGGDRVKILAPDFSPQEFQASIVSFRNGTLRLYVGNMMIRDIPLEDIRELQVVRKRGNGRTGAVIGMAVGALGGGLSALSWETCSHDEFFCWGPEDKTEAFAMGAVIFSLLGLLVGNLVGRGIQSPYWEHVDLNLLLMPGSARFDGATGPVAPSVSIKIPFG